VPIRISVTGDLGSGKSTICRQLNTLYDLGIYSTGAIQRKIADEMGMSTFELNKYMESHPEIDRRIDDGLVELSASPDDIVIDSRMAWHFVEDTYKVFLTADGTVAAKRVVGDDLRSSEKYPDIEAAKQQLKARKASENYRYAQKYGVDCRDLRNYDIVVDTTSASPALIADLIMASFKARSGPGPQLQISRYCLYPTKDLAFAPADAADGTRVGAILCGGFFYIYSGHNGASAAIKANSPFIQCGLLAVGGDTLDSGASAEEYVNKNFSLSRARAWEDAHGFSYYSYPR
jgi:predicted cytidylate kinase